MPESNQTHQAAATDSGTERPKRRWLRRLLLIGGLLLVLLVVLLLMVPTMVSTAAGRGFLLGAVNDRIVGKVEADGLSVGWLSGQSVTGVVVRDADGNEVARVGRVGLPDASLWSLVRGSLALGELRIESVKADLVGYEDGTTNLQRALAARGGQASNSRPGKTTPGGGAAGGVKWPGGLALGVVVRDVDISYRAAGVADPIRVTVPEADLTATDPTHLLLKLNAELSQANRKGSFTADAQIDQLFDASGVYQPGKAAARVDAQVSDLPVELLDGLANQGGKLSAVLGPILNGRVLADVTTSGGSASVTASSEHLEVDARFAFDNAGLAGVGTSHIKLTLTPQAWSAISAKGGKAGSTLAQPVDVAIELAGFGLPIKDTGLDLAHAKIDLGLTVGDVRLGIAGINGVDQVALTSTTGEIHTARLGESLTANFKTTSSINRKPGGVAVDARIDRLFGVDGVYQPSRAAARIDAKVSDLPIGLLDTLMNRGGEWVVLLGPMINGEVMADVTASGGEASVRATSEHLRVNAKLAFDPSGVTLADASSVRLTLTPRAWEALTAAEGKPASTLAQPVDIAIELAKFGLPINDKGVDLAHANLDLGLAVGNVRLQIDRVGEVTLESTTGGIRSEQLGKRLTANFKTTSSINRKPGGVAVGIELADLIGADQQINAAGLSARINGALTNAPVAAILDELLPGVTHGLATQALGPVMDAKINLHAAPGDQGQGVAGGFDLDLLTGGAEAGLTSTLIGGFRYDKHAIHADLAEGSYAKLTLTPGLIRAFREAFGASGETSGSAGTPAVSLGGPATVRLDLTRASARLQAGDPGGYALDRSSVRLVGKLTSPQLVLDQAGKLAATLKGLLVDVDSAGPAGETRMVLNADIEYAQTAGKPPKPGAIESTTTVTGPPGAGEVFDMTAVAIQTDTHIRQAPIDLIDAMLGMGGDLVASVGPRARVDAVGSYAPGAGGHSGGGIDLTLKSRAASADMKLLVEDGQWKLKADAPLSFRVTPSLSQVMLKKVNPFLGGALSAKLPIGVTIKREGFSVPLRNADIKDVKADINLDLGELNLRGEGGLKKVLEVLGASDRSLLNAKFSPVVVTLAGGKLSYKDLTMSLGDVVLGFSGVVDLGSERLDLKMTIPGTSLNNIKWLKGAVSPDQVIVVPLTGTFDKPSLDFKLLSGEIAKMALRGQFKGEAGDAIGDKIGGEAGAVVGGLLNDLLGGPEQAGASEGTAETQPDATDTTQEGADGQPAQPGVRENARERGKPAADRPLTDEERRARRERRRKRRERLERKARQAQP